MVFRRLLAPEKNTNKLSFSVIYSTHIRENLPNLQTLETLTAEVLVEPVMLVYILCGLRLLCCSVRRVSLAVGVSFLCLLVSRGNCFMPYVSDENNRQRTTLPLSTIFSATHFETHPYFLKIKKG